MNIEDYSYSGISDLIQGDVQKGKEAIISMTEDYLAATKQIEETKKKLQALEAQRTEFFAGVHNVLRHLKRDAPLSVIKDLKLIVITDKCITLETNVL